MRTRVSESRGLRILAVLVLAFALSSWARQVALGGEEAKEVAKPIDPELLNAVPEELRYTRVNLPDKENAFPLWEKAAEKSVKPDDALAEEIYRQIADLDLPLPEAELGERLREWLKANEESLKLLDQGLALGKCQFPESTGYDSLLPDFTSQRMFARLMQVRVKVFTSKGADSPAALEVERTIRFGEMLQGGDGGELQYLVGAALQSVALEGARWIAAGKRISTRNLEQLLSHIAPAQETDEALAQAFKEEFTHFFLDALSRTPQDPEHLLPLMVGVVPAGSQRVALKDIFASNPKPLDKVATVHLAAAFLAQSVKNARGTWHERALTLDEQLRGQKEKLRAELAGIASLLSQEDGSKPSKEKSDRASQEWAKVENPAGRAFVAEMMPNTDPMLERSFRVRAERELTRALIALRIYELRHRRLPDSLDELVREKILPGLPMDPFAGKPLRYDAERRRIWSVGPDEADDGGNDKPNLWGAKDYVVVIP